MPFLRGGLRMDPTVIDKNYLAARERYAQHGIDAEKALERLQTISLSLHCWQGDDVGGFEKQAGTLDGSGLQVTGSYPGRARTVESSGAAAVSLSSVAVTDAPL